MAVNIAGFRRNLKNVAHNYTDAQVKVREATSNDPWGPSSTMMSEISDMTYKESLLNEIMQMIWKRLNDHGRNWRHVYKALVLLEYLIKTGDTRVGFQCKENIHTIKTLKDFQYFEENKDQGINVREKAKILVSLLSDNCRMQEERARALKAKNRFAQSTKGTVISQAGYNIGSGPGDYLTPQMFAHQEAPTSRRNTEMEASRPKTAGEEELQLQLAIAMSREEADQEESKSKSDDMRLQIAIQKSKNCDSKKAKNSDEQTSNGQASASSELFGIDFGHQTPPSYGSKIDPWGMQLPPCQPNATRPTQLQTTGVNEWAFGLSSGTPLSDPWSANGNKSTPALTGNSDDHPWPSSTEKAGNHFSHGDTGGDPWTSSTPASATHQQPLLDPFSPVAQSQLAEFDLVRNEIENVGNFVPLNPTDNNNDVSSDPFDLSQFQDITARGDQMNGRSKKSAVEELVGQHSDLVNLDNLGAAGGTGTSRNPFDQQPQNPFQVNKTPKPALNKMGSRLDWNNQPPTSFNAPPSNNADPFF